MSKDASFKFKCAIKLTRRARDELKMAKGARRRLFDAYYLRRIELLKILQNLFH